LRATNLLCDAWLRQKRHTHFPTVRRLLKSACPRQDGECSWYSARDEACEQRQKAAKLDAPAKHQAADETTLAGNTHPSAQAVACLSRVTAILPAPASMRAFTSFGRAQHGADMMTRKPIALQAPCPAPRGAPAIAVRLLD
jgi:hypothetical protein